MGMCLILDRLTACVCCAAGHLHSNISVFPNVTAGLNEYNFNITESKHHAECD